MERALTCRRNVNEESYILARLGTSTPPVDRSTEVPWVHAHRSPRLDPFEVSRARVIRPWPLGARAAVRPDNSRKTSSDRHASVARHGDQGHVERRSMKLGARRV